MNYQEFQQHLAQKKFAPVYFLLGSETYLVDECVEQLTELLVDPQAREFNFDVFYAGQVDAGKLLDIANAYPMMAESRLVVIKEVQKLPGTGLEAFAKYLDNPSPATKFILTAEKVDGRNKAIAKIKARSVVVELKPLYDNQVPQWIQGEVKRRGLQISHAASLLLHAYVGNNLQAICNEIDKLQLNLNGKTSIDEQDIQDIVGLSRKFTVFNLNDAIGNRDLPRALTILNKMLQSGESPTGILAMITRHFNTILKIKGALQARKPQNEIVALTGLRPYFITKTRPMAEKYSFDKLQDVFQLLLQTELKLKTSKMQPDIALQTLLVQIIHS